MKSVYWNRVLRLLLSASLAASLVPTPAIAEALDEMSPPEAVEIEVPNDEGNSEIDDTNADAVVSEGEASVEDSEDVDNSTLTETDNIQDDVIGDTLEEPEATAEPEAEAELVPQVEINELILGETVHVGLEKGATWVGKFTAPSKGTYWFSNDNDRCYSYLYADEALSQFVGSLSSSTGGCKALNAGETLYLSIRTYYSDVEFNVSVKTLTPYDLNAGETVHVEAHNIWLGRFTAPSAGDYSFCSTVNDCFMYADETLKNYVADVCLGRPVRSLAAGETVYLVACGQLDIDVSVSSRLGAVWTDLAADTSTAVSLASGQFLVGRFDVPETGEYTLVTSGEQSHSVELYYNESLTGRYGATVNRGNSAGREIRGTLTAGTTLFVKVLGSNYDALSCNLELRKVAVTRDTISLGKATNASSSFHANWAGSFTAPKKADYVFYSTGDADPYCTVYADEGMTKAITNSGYGGEGQNFRTQRVRLEAGQTVYLNVRDEYYGDMACAVTVEQADVVPVANMSVDNTIATSAEKGSYWLGRFTAPKDGRYTFEATVSNTESGGSTNLTLYRDEGMTERIAGSYTYGNYVQRIRLSAGDTVYLKAEPSGTGTTQIQATCSSGVNLSQLYTSVYPYSYLPTGKPIEPNISIGISVTDVNGRSVYETLERGVDYEITGYAETSDSENLLDAAPSSLGSYYAYCDGIGDNDGTCRASFSIATVSVSNLINSYTNFVPNVVWGLQSDRYYYYSNKPTYVATGDAIKPTVKFTCSYDVYVPVEGVDFTVSYANANGDPVESPTEVGDYSIVVTALDGGTLTGSGNVSFAIVGSKDINSLKSSRNPQPENEGYQSNGKGFLFDDLADAISGLVMQLLDGPAQLVEGLDYIVSTVRGDVYHDEAEEDSYDLVTHAGDGAAVRERKANNYDSYLVTLSGIGSYTGSVSADVYYAQTTQDSFNGRQAEGLGDGGSAFVTVNTSGVVSQAPVVSIAGLTQGVDYEVAGVLGADGTVPDRFSVGDEAYVRVVGLGDYEGCERLIGTTVIGNSFAVSLSQGDASFSLTNGVNAFKGDAYAWYLLKSASPKVAVLIGEAPYCHVLTEGNGLTVTKKTSGNTMELTVTSDGNNLAAGMMTQSVNLVDKYDLNSLVSSVSVDGERYTVGDTYGVQLRYEGCSFVPTVELGNNFYMGLMPTYSVTLLNASGSTVSNIASAGSYTMRLTGTGDWTGTIEVPLTVAASTSSDGINLAKCTLTVGDAPLVGGKAEPAVTVSYKGRTFKAGTDFTVEYGNNDQVAKRAWAKATAKKGGALFGFKAANFTVLPASSSPDISDGSFYIRLQSPVDPNTYYTSGKSAADVPVYRMSGTTPVKPAVQLVDKRTGGVVDASSYTVEYGNNTGCGTAYVKLTGKNGYTGTITANFYVLGTATLTADASTVGVSIGKTAVFSCAVTGAGNATLTYKWQQSDDSGKSWSDSSDNDARKATMSVVATKDIVGKRVFRCVVTASDGRMATSDAVGFATYADGWVDLPNGRKGYCKGGVLVTGWFDLNGAKYYFDEDGRMLVGWNDVVVDGKTMHYYFHPSGNLARNTWATIDGKNYYFRPSGNMATGWATINDNGVDKKYYFLEDGTLVKGRWFNVVNDEGITNHYYFRPSGSMATEWANIDGKMYFFRPSGNMATGFADVPDDAFKRYFDDNGTMVTGWRDINGNRYYFRGSGAMQTGTATIDGKSYNFSDKGVLIG